MSFVDFLDPLISALLLAGIYAAMSVGMTVIYGVMKIVNLAHASVMMLGAYFAYVLFIGFHLGRFHIHIDPLLGAVASLPVFFLFGMGLYWVLVRWLPKSNQPTLASLLLMFGVSLVLQNIAYLIWKNEDRSITTSYTLSSYHLGPFYLSKVRVIVFVAAVASVIILQIALRKSWFGRGMRSLVQNPYASQIVGVDDRRTSMLTFGLGTAFAGFAGALLGLLFSFSPDFGRPFLLRSFVIIVLGGLESFAGVALGALVLALVESYSIFIPGMEASYQPAISYLLLVVVLLFLPKGMAGLLERKWRSG